MSTDLYFLAKMREADISFVLFALLWVIQNT